MAGFQNKMMDKVPKKKTMSVNFSQVLFPLSFTHDDLATHALVWFHMIQFRVMWFGMV
jgi:hypothetical protein